MNRVSPPMRVPRSDYLRDSTQRPHAVAIHSARRRRARPPGGSIPELGHQLCLARLQRRDPSPEPAQLTVDSRQLRLRLPVLQAAVSDLGLDPLRPRGEGVAGTGSRASSRGGTAAHRSGSPPTISSWVSPSSARAVLSLSVAPLRCHSESSAVMDYAWITEQVQRHEAWRSGLVPKALRPRPGRIRVAVDAHEVRAGSRLAPQRGSPPRSRTDDARRRRACRYGAPRRPR